MKSFKFLLILSLLFIIHTSQREPLIPEGGYWGYCPQRNSHSYLLKNIDCSNQDICGITADGNFHEFNSIRQACKKQDIISYLLSPCSGKCIPFSKALCRLDYNPVCAYKDSDPSNKVTQFNICAACSNDFDHYSLGPCVHRCPHHSKKTDVCFLLEKPVCGYGNGNSIPTTFTNSCFACQHSKYYVDGPCHHVCTKKEKEAEACTKELNWKCGFLANGTYENFANGCVACSSDNVLSYIDGLCPEFPILPYLK